jgi:hypothetical protein
MERLLYLQFRASRFALIPPLRSKECRSERDDKKPLGFPL